MNIVEQLIKEFGLKPFQVQNTVKLIDEGNTSRLLPVTERKLTGELNDQV